jgi:hypothetical protein
MVDLKWKPITEAPEKVREVAAVILAELGRSRVFTRHYDEGVYLFWTGFAPGSPVELWMGPIEYPER